MKHGRSGSCDFVVSAAGFDGSVIVVHTERTCPCLRMGPFTVSHIYSGRAADRPQGSSNDVPCLPSSFTTATRGGL